MWFLLLPILSALLFLHPETVIAQSSCTLNSSFQFPYLGAACAHCIIGQRSDIRPFFDASGHSNCTDVQIVHDWCNGGVSHQAEIDCASIKNGICSSAGSPSCVIPTVPPNILNPTVTPPAPVVSENNPRGCGILYTSRSPSCYCDSGGGQGLCAELPVEGPGGCRELCESGTFTGPKGSTFCFKFDDGTGCNSNDDGSYRFCRKECDSGKPGYSHTIGCTYPNQPVIGPNIPDPECNKSWSLSSNLSFLSMMDKWVKRIIRYADVSTFTSSLVRVPGLQKASCNPVYGDCTYKK